MMEKRPEERRIQQTTVECEATTENKVVMGATSVTGQGVDTGPVSVTGKGPGNPSVSSQTGEKKPLSAYLDHTLLKPEATTADIIKLCQEAKEHHFYAVCVNACYVAPAKKELAGSDVKIAAVVGFPLGACTAKVKAFETALACEAGACEIDMVLAIGAMKDGRYDDVLEDIEAVVKEARNRGALVKVILETCLLTDAEVVKACELAERAGASFVKTSTGFAGGGATVHHVQLMKDTVGDRLSVKASGGIRTRQDALLMIEAGADRIGASASVQMME